MKNFYFADSRSESTRPSDFRHYYFKWFIKMKVTTFFVLCFALQTFARVDAQEVSLQMKQASLEKVLSELRKQVGVSFVVESALLKQANPVTVAFNKVDLKSSLEFIFRDQPIQFEMKDLV